MSVQRWWQAVAMVAMLLVLAVPVLTRVQNNNPQNDEPPAANAAGKPAKSDTAADKVKKVEKANADDTEQAEKTRHNEHTAVKNRKTAAERAKAASLPAALIADVPQDVSTLDIYNGIGGKDGAPNPNDTFTFLAEDLSQTQPKMDVRDSEGRRWRIKMGLEAKPETAATRLVWAAGYLVDTDYYLPMVKVTGIRHLKRGGQFVDADGTVHGARFKLMPKNEKNIGYWNWSDNPFVGTKELNGLRVAMALLSNWDLVQRNNKIYETNSQRRYVVSDLGASFGRSGHEGERKKGNEEAYSTVKFITKTTDQTVSFYDDARPLPFTAVAVHYYHDLVEGEKVVQDIPRADARAMGQRLSRLSDRQLLDCFRAAGYDDDEAAAYSKVLRQRINDLVSL